MVSFYKTNKICTTILCDTKAVFVLTSNHFRKCFSVNEGVWLHMENKFSGSYLKLTEKMSLWPQKWFEDQFFTSNHFRVRRAERERERERERAQITPSMSPVNPELQSDDHMHQIACSSLTIARSSPMIERKPRSHAPVRRSRGSPDRTLQSNDWEEAKIARSSLTIDLAFDLAFDPSIFDPPISFCDFDFCCCCGGVVVVFWWLWLLIAGVCCRGLNWSFGGVWCWDLAVILKFFVIKFVWMLRKWPRKCEKFVGK